MYSVMQTVYVEALGASMYKYQELYGIMKV